MKKIIFILFVFIVVMVGCKENNTEDNSVEFSQSSNKITLGLQKLITPELIVQYEKKYEKYRNCSI